MVAGVILLYNIFGLGFGREQGKEMSGILHNIHIVDPLHGLEVVGFLDLVLALLAHSLLQLDSLRRS